MNTILYIEYIIKLLYSNIRKCEVNNNVEQLQEKSETILEMSDTLKMLGDKSRLTMLALLRERELCVCDLVDLIGMSQPGVSQHLRKLKSAGLVNETRKGTWIYYSLNVEDKPYIQAVLNYIPSLKEKIEQLKGCCD
jgi:ArsR family transcriptional regulator